MLKWQGGGQGFRRLGRKGQVLSPSPLSLFTQVGMPPPPHTHLPATTYLLLSTCTEPAHFLLYFHAYQECMEEGLTPLLLLPGSSSAFLPSFLPLPTKREKRGRRQAMERGAGGVGDGWSGVEAWAGLGGWSPQTSAASPSIPPRILSSQQLPHSGMVFFLYSTLCLETGDVCQGHGCVMCFLPLGILFRRQCLPLYYGDDGCSLILCFAGGRYWACLFFPHAPIHTARTHPTPNLPSLSLSPCPSAA